MFRDLEDDLYTGSGGGGATGGGVKETKAVGQLRKGLMFTDTDAPFIKDHLGAKAAPYDAFFVDTSGGDYSEVWGIHGIVPTNAKTAYRIV